MDGKAAKLDMVMWGGEGKDKPEAVPPCPALCGMPNPHCINIC